MWWARLAVLTYAAAMHASAMGLYELVYVPEPLHIATEVIIPATIRSCVGQATVAVASRSLYKFMGYNSGIFPGTEENETISQLIPDKPEMERWIRSGLVRIGARGHFSGSEALLYDQNPFAMDEWVDASSMRKVRENTAIFYHNLYLSWDARLWNVSHPVHYSKSPEGEFQVYFVGADGELVCPVEKGRYFARRDHALLIQDVPPLKTTKRDLHCYIGRKLACRDDVTGNFITFPGNPREGAVPAQPLKACMGGTCYTIDPADIDDHLHHQLPLDNPRWPSGGEADEMDPRGPAPTAFPWARTSPGPTAPPGYPRGFRDATTTTTPAPGAEQPAPATTAFPDYAWVVRDGGVATTTEKGAQGGPLPEGWQLHLPAAAQQAMSEFFTKEGWRQFPDVPHSFNEDSPTTIVFLDVGALLAYFVTFPPRRGPYFAPSLKTLRLPSLPPGVGGGARRATCCRDGKC